jgi:hypothetical protein
LQKEHIHLDVQKVYQGFKAVTYARHTLIMCQYTLAAATSILWASGLSNRFPLVLKYVNCQQVATGMAELEELRELKQDVERRERAQATVIENQARRLEELDTLYKVCSTSWKAC